MSAQRPGGPGSVLQTGTFYLLYFLFLLRLSLGNQVSSELIRSDHRMKTQLYFVSFFFCCRFLHKFEHVNMCKKVTRFDQKIDQYAQ